VFARIRRPLIVTAALLLTAGVAGAQGYGVRSWGYYDPVPYGPVVGGTYSYSPYRPTVTFQDPFGRAYDMPLRPKVLYYDAPFLTPQGGYRPTSITVMPNSRPQAYTVPAGPPMITQPATPPAPSRPLPTFRYDGGPATPIPDVTDDPPAAKPRAPRIVPSPSLPQSIPPTVPAPRPAARATVPDRPVTVPAAPELPAVPDVATSPPAAKAPPPRVIPDLPPAKPIRPTVIPEPPAAKATVTDRPAAVPAIPDLPPVPKVPALPDMPKAPGADAGPAVPKLGPTPMDVPPAPRPGG
jgi:hypothetical protein